MAATKVPSPFLLLVLQSTVAERQTEWNPGNVDTVVQRFMKRGRNRRRRRRRSAGTTTVWYHQSSNSAMPSPLPAVIIIIVAVSRRHDSVEPVNVPKIKEA
jgi:hypothetical protein